MTKVTEPPEGEAPTTVGVAVSTFNQAVTDRLLEGALTALEEAAIEEVIVLRVAGALELPVAVARLFEAGCSAVVAVGAVIKGETDHYEHVARESARGLTDVSIRYGRPVGNAVLTVTDLSHALDRSLPGPSNKGAEAARAAVATSRALEGLGG